MRVEKARMMRSAVRTCEFLGLRPGDTALLCMDLKYIGAKMMVVRALVAGLHLWVRRPSGHPLADVEEWVDFLSVVPMQLYHTLEQADERERLSRVRCVIVGGRSGGRGIGTAFRVLALPGVFHLRHDRNVVACRFAST